MADMMNSENYPAQFRQNIIDGLAYLLDQVSSGPPAFNPDYYQQSIHLLDYGLRIAAAWPQCRDLLLRLSPIVEQAGYRDEWITLLERGLEHSIRENDTTATGRIYYYAGILYERRGRHTEAETSFVGAVQVFAELKLFQDQACALNRLGQLYRRQRRYDKAVAAVNQAFTLLPDDDPERGYGHLVLANTALDGGDLSTALTHLEHAYQLWAGGQNKRMMSWSLSNMGMVYRQQKNYIRAIEVYEQAMQLLAEVVDPVNLALTQMNLGNVYFDLDEFEKALALYQLAEPVFKQAGEVLRLGKLYRNMGRVYQSHQQQWDEAAAAYEQSLAYFRLLQDKVEQFETLKQLNTVFSVQGKPEKVIEPADESSLAYPQSANYLMGLPPGGSSSFGE